MPIWALPQPGHVPRPHRPVHLHLYGRYVVGVAWAGPVGAEGSLQAGYRGGTLVELCLGWVPERLKLEVGPEQNLM